MDWIVERHVWVVLKMEMRDFVTFREKLSQVEVGEGVGSSSVMQDCLLQRSLLFFVPSGTAISSAAGTKTGVRMAVTLLRGYHRCFHSASGV